MELEKLTAMIELLSDLDYLERQRLIAATMVYYGIDVNKGGQLFTPSEQS